MKLAAEPEYFVWFDSMNHWFDSMNHGSGGWGRLSTYREAMTEAGMRHESVGWVLHEDDSSVAICNSRATEDPDDPNDLSVSNVMQIPKVAIISRQRLFIGSRE